MIRSMTGFGAASFEVQGVAFEAEIRSVNHRHLDVHVRLPRGFAAFEAGIRAQLRERLARGKLDVGVRAGAGAQTGALELDLAAAEQYLCAAEALRERHGLAGTLDVPTLLALPGVARLGERALPPEALRDALHGGIETALDAVLAMREAEGRVLERELRCRLARVAELTDALEARAGEVQRAVRERLAKRAAELQRETGFVDEARLQQEIAFAADRMDVVEEVVRLRSHVAQFRDALDRAGPGQPAGRRLGFLLQEMGREANTIGAKGSDAPVAHQVVELKSELERLREQVQNVE